MELGEKLRRARLEAGLSQRQLCGEEITRNMLSQIEHGSAKPSMKTLRYLAGQLGKSVSYFLEEETVLSPNLGVMEQARKLLDSGSFREASDVLSQYRAPDAVYDRERQLLQVLVGLALASDALRAGKTVYARELLNKLPLSGCYCEVQLQREQQLLLGKAGERCNPDLLPDLDEELLLRAQTAFADGDLLRAAQLLDAARNRDEPRWALLRGQIYLAQSQYEQAARHLHRAEEVYPKESYFRLEHCYRELGDYRLAYEYACRQR